MVFGNSLVTYLRLFLGRHTIDQLVLGTLLGVWSALFMHFCLRDKIYRHITEITNGPNTLSTQQTLKYTLDAFGIASCFYGITVITVILVKTFSTTDQSYMQNLSQ